MLKNKPFFLRKKFSYYMATLACGFMLGWSIMPPRFIRQHAMQSVLPQAGVFPKGHLDHKTPLPLTCTPQVNLPWQDDVISVLLGSAQHFCGVRVKGLVHVGAHHAEEQAIYHKHGIKNVLWVEPNEAHRTILEAKIKAFPGHRTAFFAAGEEEKQVILNFYDYHTGGASVLPFADNEKTLKKAVSQKRLDDYVKDLAAEAHYNVLVLDTQGYELSVLKGATGMLNNVDAIIAEVSKVFVYQDQTQIEDLDAFLNNKGFVRVQTLPSHSLHHGDALYVKKSFVPKSSLNDLADGRPA